MAGTTTAAKTPTKTAAKAASKTTARTASKTTAKRPAPTSTPATDAPTVVVIDVAAVDPHPANPRLDLGDLTELAASIKTDGVRQPIHVVPTTSDGTGGTAGAEGQARYVVVDGHRRRAATLDAGVTTIPAIIRTDITDAAAAVVDMLVQNVLRTDLTPVEEANAYEQLRLAGVTVTQIARKTGRKKATVDARLALLKLPDATRKKVHGQQITIETAAALLEFADDPATVKRLEQYISNPQNFQWELQGARRRRDDKARREQVTAQLQADGVQVVTRASLGDGWWKHQLRHVYQDVDVPGITEDTTPRQDDEARRAVHVSCPHHAAYIEQDGSASYVCLDPTVHTPAVEGGTQTSIGDEVTAREAAERAERAAQERRDCETAAGIRGAFVRDLVCGRRGILSAAGVAEIALFVAETLGTVEDPEFWVEPADVAGWLEVDLSEREGADRRTYEQRRADEARDGARLRTQMSRRGGGSALLAVAAAVYEGAAWGRLSAVGTWSFDSQPLRSGAPAREYLQLLTVLGYELTEWEQARLDAIDERAADDTDDSDDEPDDPDETDDDLDDEGGTPVEDVVTDL